MEQLAYEEATNLYEIEPPVKERILQYWENRSSSFAIQRKHELEDAISDRWMTEIENYMPAGKQLRILDVGTGTGYFAILLAKRGHQVTGIDLTPSMIEEAKELASQYEVDADFHVMDAEHPDFERESFDMIISRNLTWTLPHPKQAYKKWCSLLRSGGVLLNFDADYGHERTTDFSKLPEHHAHKTLGMQMLAENDSIKKELYISEFPRPVWDVQTLLELRMEKVQIDTGISKRIYLEKDELYNPTPLFALCCVKP